MTLTLAETQAIVAERCAMFMERIEWTTANLVGPIAWAVQVLGYDTTSLNVADDADLANLPADYDTALVDVAEMRTLEMIEQNFGLVGMSVGDISQRFGELGDRLSEIIARKRTDVLARHGDKIVIPIGDIGKNAPKPISIKAW